MNAVLSRISIVVLMITGVVAACAAQDYEIKLSRVEKVGDHYNAVLNCTSEQHLAMTISGKQAPARDEVITATMTVEATVQSITADGRELKARYVVKKSSKTIGTQTSDIVPADTEIIAERAANNRTQFTVAGAPATPDITKILKMLISEASEQGKTDDDIFGSKKPKKVGDTWPIDGAAAAADAATKDQLTIDPANISGATTLEDVSAEKMKVTGIIDMKNVGMPLPPGMAVTSSKFHASFSGVFPLDVSKHSISSGMTMDGTFECAGKSGDKELTMVVNMKMSKLAVYTIP